MRLRADSDSVGNVARYRTLPPPLLRLTLAAPLLAAACGDDSEVDSATTTGEATATTTGATTTTTTTAATETTTGATTSGTATSTTGATSDGTTGDPVELVDVAHHREFRAVWVATVFNINFPSEQGLSAADGMAELDALVDVAEAAGLNALVFQVRPEGDALYASAIEPWSRYLTGAQGDDPGYDPLAYLIDVAHPRGIEVHAWLNPYRAKASKSSAAAAGHMAVDFAEYAYPYGDALWMDPGAEAVQDRLIDVISDLVGNYAIDGIHYDDYFYPYPDGPFPDDATYDAYVDGGGTLELGDWRRDNVNRMVKRSYETIVALRPEVRFGISPFGIYRPGMPPGINGLDQYTAIFADPLHWMNEGHVDYLAPQLYWPTTQTAQAYGALIEWWSGIVTGGRYIFAGNYLSKLGSAPEWSVDEFRAQLDLSADFYEQGSQGNIFFQIAPLQSNQEGITDVLRGEYYGEPALTPPLAARVGELVAPPEVVVDGEGVTLSHGDAAGLRAYVVYRGEGDGWAIDRIVPADAGALEVPLDPGEWAISAAALDGVESQGVVVTIR